MLHAVIMAGGSGTRFWPLSRQALPKQCLALGTTEPLIKETSNRLFPLIPRERQHIVAGHHLESVLKPIFTNWEQTQFIWEPAARNTAPCIALAALLIAKDDPDAVLAVLPSDHHIKDTEAFRSALELASRSAMNDELVTLGIRPTRAETGFGYIELDEGTALDTNPLSVKRFVEKPHLELAKSYVDGGRHLWNSGMFIFKARRILDDLRKYQPALYAGLSEIEKHLGEKTYNRALLEIFPRLPSISIDYGVLEPCSNDPEGKPITVIPTAFGWNDVGSWDALSDYSPTDEDGNVATGRVISIDNSKCIIQSHGPTIAAIGVENMVIVSTEDSVLVCPRNMVQRVKEVPSLAKKLGWDELC